MNLCVLAYPSVSTSDYERIQEFRQHNDELYFHVVEPHFTLAFPLAGWEVEPYIAEVKKQLQGFRSFDFCIRCATLDKDAFSDFYHAFLVPDEGHSQIVKLHYQLCADKFFPYRQLHVDFIPHIGIGRNL
jgi:2'-5' RNA ligase superfamily protein